MKSQFIDLCKALIFVLLISCNSGTTGLLEFGDGDMLIQLQRREENLGVNRFRVRLLPGIKSRSFLNDICRVNMTYHMDSSFYLLRGKNLVYPLTIQPVAGGVSNAFDYLVDFESDLPDSSGMVFNYRDKFLNKKTYRFTLLNGKR